MTRIHQAAPEELDAIIEREGLSEKEILRRLREPHKEFCRRLKIHHKSGTLLPPDWSPSWGKLQDAIDKQERQGLPVRGYILKGRQVHFTAGAMTHMYRRVAFMPGQHARVFSDKAVDTASAWRYGSTYARTYSAKNSLRPLGGFRSNKNELLEWERDSWIEFGTAGTTTGGRSAPVRYALLDEFAFWPDPEALMTGFMQSVPLEPNTMVLIPSTANGAGGAFWERCQEVMDPAYKGGWFFLFVAWWEHHENVYPISDVRRFQDSLTREELEIQRQYNLSLPQLHWRKITIRDTCEGSMERFHQEHPSCPEEAFLTSGRPRFDLISLGRMVASRDAAIGHLERIPSGTQQRIVFVPHQDGRGELQIFKRPTQGRNYVIGADPAEGIDVREGKGASDPDYSDCYVCDQDTGEQVACFHARLEPDPAADALCTLAEWYNWAFIVPEVNSVGLAFIQAILYRNYPIHLIYHRDRDPDDRRPPLLQELGWKETHNTRQQLVSLHDRILRELSANIACPHCLGQHRTFIIRPDGRAEHQQGCHDDAVFAGALASVGLQVAPRIRALIEARKPKPVDLDEDEDDDRRGRRYRTARRYK
jgi:hypothetical protein